MTRPKSDGWNSVPPLRVLGILRETSDHGVGGAPANSGDQRINYGRIAEVAAAARTQECNTSWHVFWWVVLAQKAQRCSLARLRV
jgi:hypothetical protein